MGLINYSEAVFLSTKTDKFARTLETRTHPKVVQIQSTV